MQGSTKVAQEYSKRPRGDVVGVISKFVLIFKKTNVRGGRNRGVAPMAPIHSLAHCPASMACLLKRGAAMLLGHGLCTPLNLNPRPGVARPPPAGGGGLYQPPPPPPPQLYGGDTLK